jgi:hypothetical protein
MAHTPQTYWAVFNRWDEPCLHTIRWTRKDAITAAIQEFDPRGAKCSKPQLDRSWKRLRTELLLRVGKCHVLEQGS